MYFAAALEADGGKDFCAAVLSLPVNSSKLWSGYIFLQYSCAKGQHFPRDAPPAILGTDIDLGYLGIYSS